MARRYGRPCRRRKVWKQIQSEVEPLFRVIVRTGQNTMDPVVPTLRRGSCPVRVFVVAAPPGERDEAVALAGLAAFNQGALSGLEHRVDLFLPAPDDMRARLAHPSLADTVEVAHRGRLHGMPPASRAASACANSRRSSAMRCSKTV